MTDNGERLEDPRLHSTPARLDKRLLAAVVLPLIVLYATTATWMAPYHGDAMTNVITAWYIGNSGSPIAHDHAAVAVPEQRGNFVWIVPSDRGPVSQYPPGAALLAAPVYWALNAPMEQTQAVGSNRPDLPPVDFPMPPIWPAAIVAIVTSALAIGFLALTCAELGSRRSGLAAGLVAGLGTSAWSVASDMYWQHGPAMMWIALAGYLSARDRLGWAGVAFGAAVLTRPHLAVIAASVGIGVAMVDRRIRPALVVGATSGLGLALLVAYNYWLLGTYTVSGAYGGDFTANFFGMGIRWYVENLWGALFDQWRGLILWTPMLLPLIVGIPAARREIPRWASAAAVGGVLYLLIQYRANRFSGGDGHFSYRYPLEALVAAGPLLFVAYREGLSRNHRLKRMFWAAALVSIAMHGAGAVLWPEVLID